VVYAPFIVAPDLGKVARRLFKQQVIVAIHQAKCMDDCIVSLCG
jgi:hypothetical protein